MSILLLLVAGFLSDFGEGDPCIDALHQLRTEQRMQIVATEVLEDNVLAFTLGDSPRLNEKTALLVCQRDVDDADAAGADVDEDLEGADDTIIEGTDDTLIEPMEPADNLGDEGVEEDDGLQ
jgi:hypothetical protein